MKKTLYILGFVILAFILLGLNTKVKAYTSINETYKTKVLRSYSQNSDGTYYGFAIGNGQQSSGGAWIWNIVKSMDSTVVPRNYYCVYAGVGFQNDGNSRTDTYDRVYDLESQEDITAIQNSGDTVANTFISNSNFSKILTATNSFFIPDNVNNNQSSAIDWQINILKNYIDEDEFDFEEAKSDHPEYYLITDYIMALQQKYIWTLTNPTTPYTNAIGTIKATTEENQNTTTLVSYPVGNPLTDFATYVYDYLGKASSTANYCTGTIGNSIETSGNYYLLGPINLNITGTATVSLTVTDSNNNAVSYDLVNSSGKVLTGTGDDKTSSIFNANSGKDIYVRVAKGNIDIKVNVNYSYDVIKKYLYTNSQSTVYQPFIELVPTSVPNSLEGEFKSTSTDFKVIFNKVDKETSNFISGSVFNINGSEYTISKQDGEFEVVNISKDNLTITYDFYETTSPNGYDKLPYKFKVTVNFALDSNSNEYKVSGTIVKIYDSSGNEVTDDKDAGEYIAVAFTDNSITITLKNDETVETNFDLALRKYIIKVNDEQITNRTPDISLGQFAEGVSTTATYNHRKDPVEVKRGALVTYRIQIYNEGDDNGYAMEVKDQLPSYLEYVSYSASDYTYTSYDTDTNVVTFTAKSTITPLKGYSTGDTTLSSTYIDVVCKVTTSAPNSKVLTNVAYISREYNSTKSEEIINTGDDRDSLPSTTPKINGNDINKDNIEDYTGKDTQTDLTQNTYYQGCEDDDDFEKVVVKPEEFDLALRKYITQVDTTKITSRSPDISTSSISTTGTATYNHRKDPVEVVRGSEVTYTITVYNEGDEQGYASQIIDQLPTNLKFDHINSNYYTASYDETTNIVTIDANENIYALNRFSTTLDSISIEVVCLVLDTAVSEQVMTNVAYISKEYNSSLDKEIIKAGEDSDSLPSNTPKSNGSDITKDNLEDYKGNTSNDDVTPANSDYFYKGYEDDDDFEKVVVKSTIFDLALRKYITKVDSTNITSRKPTINTSTIETDGTATYNHRKDPLEVERGSKVTYTITIYNEGEDDGYAMQIVDQLPNYLKYVSCNSNCYNATYDETNNKVTLVANENIYALKGFSTTLDSVSIEIVCEVLDTAVSDYVMTNIAYISRQMNTTQGIETTKIRQDSDSLPSNYPTNNGDSLQNYKGNTSNDDVEPANSNYFYKGQEDDDDFEKVIVKDRDFDLALRKYITKIDSAAVTSRKPVISTEKLDDGTSTTASYVHRKNPLEVNKDSTIEYTITIYNEGNVAGRASKIVDMLPTGLVYDYIVSGDYEWDDDYTYTTTENKVYLKQKSTTNLAAYDGTLHSTSVVIRCKVDATNIANGSILTNIAYISEEYREDSDEPITNQEREDRDSEPANNPSTTDKNLNKDTMEDYTGGVKYDVDDLAQDIYYEGEQDDDDFEKVRLVYYSFDLKLIKRITKIDGASVKERIEQVDCSKLNYDGVKTGDYTVNKNPLLVNNGSIVTYTLRVYNEGDMDGYASEITEDIPDGLEFLWSNLTGDDLTNSTLYTDAEKEAIRFNQSYYWVQTQDGKYVTTDYLSKERETRDGENLIKAYSGAGEPDYKEVSIMLKVNSTKPLGTTIRNEAAITGETDEEGKQIEDRDSDPDKWVKYEDDEDYDNIILQSFDLVLRKFIAGVSANEQFNSSDKLLNTDGTYAREPVVDTTKLDNGSTTSTYNHSKTPVIVSIGEYVIYALRIYNEGAIDGYAAEITDYLPEYLEFVDCDFNKTYGWEKVNDRVVKTSYLKDKVIKARNEDEDGNITLNYEDVYIMCHVTGYSSSSNILTNIAEISVYEDENHEEVNDRDSTENNLDYPKDGDLPTYKDDITGTYVPGQEDDDDFEKVKVYRFDLALRKWVTESMVTIDGATTSYPTNNQPYDEPEAPAKVELKKSQVSTAIVKWKFKIRVVNEGNLAGYATEITDYIPEGLSFNSADNPLWTQVSSNVVTTDQLAETLLEPGEYVDIEIILTWINGDENTGLKNNWAEISEDDNKYNIPDIDSTPNNKVETEDDMDYAPVLVSIATGGIRIFYGSLFILIPMAIAIYFEKKRRRNQFLYCTNTQEIEQNTVKNQILNFNDKRR